MRISGFGDRVSEQGEVENLACEGQGKARINSEKKKDEKDGKKRRDYMYIVNATP